jgi:hypothetical protein
VLRQTYGDADTYAIPDFMTLWEFNDPPTLVMEPTHDFYTEGADNIYYLEAWCYDAKDYVAVNTF